MKDKKLYDFTMCKIAHNKPNIVFFNKIEQAVFIIDITMPLDNYVHKTFLKNKAKKQILRMRLKISTLEKSCYTACSNRKQLTFNMAQALQENSF